MSGGQMNEQEAPVQDPAEPTEPATPEPAPEPSEPTPAPDTTPPDEEDNGGDGEE